MFSSIVALITGASKSVLFIIAGVATVAVVSVVVITRPAQTTTPTATSDPNATPAATAAPTTTLLPGTGTPAGTPATPYVSVVIDGPVDSFDTATNTIIIYNYKVKLRDDDPIRLKIKVGNWLHITGNFIGNDGDRIVIIAIVVIIVDNPTVIIVPGKGGMGDDDD